VGEGSSRLPPCQKPGAVFEPLAKSIAVSLSLAALAGGSLLVFLGLTAAGICSEPGGCRPEITWPLLIPGIALVVVSVAILLTVLRSKSKPS